MTPIPLNLLLADDDTDDCFLFREALKELPISVNLTTVNDGAQLMELLFAEEIPLPDALFLDLNMPCKSGFECLSEIKLHEKFNKLPVIIFSTSLDLDVVDVLYQKGAQHYIRKPGEYERLKKVISKAVKLLSNDELKQPSRDKFILQP